MPVRKVPEDQWQFMLQRMDKLEKAFRSTKFDKRPKIPIYDYTQLPADAVEGQIAIIENAPGSPVDTGIPVGAYALVYRGSKTFAGSGTIGPIDWAHFSTTDQDVFATSLDGSTVHNAANDTIVLLQKPGSYQIHCAVQWGSGSYERTCFLGAGSGGQLDVTQGEVVQGLAQASVTPVNAVSLWTTDDLNLWTDGSAGFGNAAMHVNLGSTGQALTQAYMGIIYTPAADFKTDVY